MDPDERHDDFDDFALPGEGPANERAAWEASRDERAARSTLYPASGLVAVAPIDPPATVGGGADPTPTTEGAPLRQRRPEPSNKKAPRAWDAGAVTHDR